jgi:hypothetical protein
VNPANRFAGHRPATVASDFAGAPFEWRSTRGAADTFQYQVDIR